MGSQKCDLNSILNCWEGLNCHVRNQKFSEMVKLTFVSQEQWLKTPIDVLINLENSMCRRCALCRFNKFVSIFSFLRFLTNRILLWIIKIKSILKFQSKTLLVLKQKKNGFNFISISCFHFFYPNRNTLYEWSNIK